MRMIRRIFSDYYQAGADDLILVKSNQATVIDLTQIDPVRWETKELEIVNANTVGDVTTVPATETIAVGAFLRIRAVDGGWKVLGSKGTGAGGGPHTHTQSDITNLTSTLGAKVDSSDPRLSDARTPLAHNHDDRYFTESESDARYCAVSDSRLSDARTPTAHTHGQSDVTGLVTALAGKQATSEKGQANGYASLGADGRVPSAQLPVSQGGGGIPAGVIVMWSGLLVNIPSGWALCDGQNGTPDLRNRFIKGSEAGVDPGQTGGSASHTHVDHQNLVHSGTSITDHVYTPQGTNSGGAVSAHTGTAVADHPDHVHGAGTIAVANHADHTHTYTQVPNHVHVQTVNVGTTGSQSGYTPDTSTSGSANSGLSTANPTGGVATATTNGASATLTHSVSGNTAGASVVLSHQVTQPANHTFTNPTFTGTQANLSHSVTQPTDHLISAHDVVNHEPPFYALAFIQKL